MKKFSMAGGAIALTAVTVLSVGVLLTAETQHLQPSETEVTHFPVVRPLETLAPVDNSVDNVPSLVEEEPEYTDEQREILAIIIYQEAGADYCSDDTRRKVGSVFLNRVKSPFFPDTFEEVATEKKQYGTLHQTGVKWPEIASTKQEEHAVERAYELAEELLINGSILPDNVIWQAEFEQGDGIYSYQDGIYFCYSEVIE